MLIVVSSQLSRELLFCHRLSCLLYLRRLSDASSSKRKLARVTLAATSKGTVSASFWRLTSASCAYLGQSRVGISPLLAHRTRT